MKNKRNLLVGLILSSTLLAGCSTSLLWRGELFARDPVLTQDIEEKEIAQDNVRAFAMVKPNTNNPHADSLVMVGDKYWYVINKKHSQELGLILQAKLSKQFVTGKIDYEGIEDEKVKFVKREFFKVTLSDKAVHKNPQFTMGGVNGWFCLYYEMDTTIPAKQQQQERQTLHKLQFKQRNPSIYQRCFMDLTGTIYQANNNFKTDYTFEKSLPVKLVMQKRMSDINVATLLTRIVATPFLLVGDIVFLPGYALYLSGY